MEEQQIKRPAGRRLKCQDPQIVQKYNNYLVTAMDIPSCLRQLQEVYKEGTNQLTKTQLDNLEIIDKQFTKSKLAAEWHCRKFHAGQVPWTPGLTIAIYKLLYWQGIKKRTLGGKISVEVLRKRARQGAEQFLVDHLKLGAEEIQRKTNQAIQDYKIIKKQATDKIRG